MEEQKLQGIITQIRATGNGLVAKIKILTEVLPEDKEKPKNLTVPCDRTWYPEDRVMITIEKAKRR